MRCNGAFQKCKSFLVVRYNYFLFKSVAVCNIYGLDVMTLLN